VKEINFHPKALKVISTFSDWVRKELGKALNDLKRGEKLNMPLSKPLKNVARGVEELRLKDSAGIYRIFYFTKLKNRILIFHAFTKKTQATPQKEIQTGQKRLKELINE